MLGLYLHVPFCSAICGYCNFNRGLFDPVLKSAYVTALAREIRQAPAGRAADTIYFGGGTPSLLEPSEVAILIETCRTAFSVPSDAEVTLETNPETADPARLEAFREAGVNRLSFGVQSFDDAELARLGRIHDARRARAAYAAARQTGFDNVSLDLMMWLPGQTVARWRANVEALVGLAPEHASLYILELYPNAPLKDDMARAGWSLAPDDDAAEMYESAMTTLQGAGYDQYEISNVARPGRESRHNLKYWQDGEWLGFGCGAHSTIDGVRWRNLASTSDYIARIAAGEPVATGRRCLSREERMQEALFTGLRLSAGVDTAALSARYGVDVAARYGGSLEPYVSAGLAAWEGARLRLTRRGMLLANEILAIFV